MVEKERKRARSTQIAIELVENRANVAHRSRRVIGKRVYEYGHTMRPIALVCHLFIFALVFTHRVFDSPFDVVFGHILAFRVSDDGPKRRVVLWFGASCLYGNGNLFTYLCKRAGHMAPSFQFRSLAIFKCSSHRIVRLRASLCPYNIVAWKNKCNMQQGDSASLLYYYLFFYRYILTLDVFTSIFCCSPFSAIQPQVCL